MQGSEYLRKDELEGAMSVDKLYVGSDRMWKEPYSMIDRYLQEVQKESILIVIDGMCAGGKTTLGKLLQERYGGNLFHMDDFFLQSHQRTQARLAEPGGNVDYERFREEIVEHLADEQGLCYGVYDCRKQQITETRQVPWQRITIVEGCYSAHPYFEQVPDLQFFLEVDADEQIRRIRERNGERMLERFQKEWIPMENKYFEAFQIREKSICVRTDL